MVFSNNKAVEGKGLVNYVTDVANLVFSREAWITSLNTNWFCKYCYAINFFLFPRSKVAIQNI